MGKVSGKRMPERKNMAWLCKIKIWTGVKTAGELFRIAMDREI